MRKSVFTTVMAAVFAVMAMTPAFAGSLDQAASPTSAGGGAMYTLEDIYQRLLNGTVATKRVGPFKEPTLGPAATGHTLDDIYNLIGAPAAVPKTGDSTDGATGVNFPNPRFTVNAGTVKDNLTGLIWLQNAKCANMTRDWATAKTDVISLNTVGKMNGNNCGDTSNAGSYQTDWRLPTLRELQSLIHYGYFSPALSDTVGTAKWTTNGDPFINVQTNYYWSATTLADALTDAWVVNLNDGYVLDVGKAGARYVLPVR